MSWNYLVPRWANVPPRAAGANPVIYSDEAPELRLGIYCAQESHRDTPWFIGSFTPNWEVHRQKGTVYWSLSDRYPTGDGKLFTVAGARERLIADGKPVPTDDDGIPIQTTEAHRQGYGRAELRCKLCDLGQPFRDETLQNPVREIVRAGVRELDLTTFIAAVKRSSATA